MLYYVVKVVNIVDKKEKNMKKLLWLDDFRDPFDEKSNWLAYNSIRIEKPFEIIWVKNYDEFIDWIIKNGLPYQISFDHDLADEHYSPDMYKTPDVYNKHYDDFREKTGMDCAKWLISYCINNNVSVPKFTVHSANPVGGENIRALLSNFIRHHPVINNKNSC